MKNIVVCCDGTNNQLETHPTNVLRLYSILQRDPERQVAYYDPGVGTLAQPWVTNPIGKRLSLAYGLAFGVGFTRNLEEAYRFLMWNYDPGDRVFLFGFSRGAFTVRALAGMVHRFGLLDREQENLLPYMSRAYLAANLAVSDRFKNLTRRMPPIDFLGLWDTVSSLGFLYKRHTLPHTASNASVHVVRQALAIDERRAYFRQNRWTGRNQDVKQVWFAGVHSDVGGGYDPQQSELAKITLEWMVEEARPPGAHTGLLIDDDLYLKQLIGEEEYQLARAQQRSPIFLPNAAAGAHESLTGPWWILEFLPMNYTLKRREFFWPLGRRRLIETQAVVHQSVLDRMTALGATYQPPNLGTLGPTEPWSRNPGIPVAAAPETFADRLRHFLAASGSVLAALYGIVALGLLLWLVGKLFVHGRGETLSWGQILCGSLGWPWNLGVWLTQHNNGWRVFLMAMPLVVLTAGAWLLARLSGLSQFVLRVGTKLLHQRWNYSRQLARTQFNALDQNGRAAYARYLKLDFLFPLCYGAALIWSLMQAHVLTTNILPDWVVYLPLVTLAFNWIENGLLLQQLARYPGNLQTKVINTASAATSVKIATLQASLVILAGLLLWAWDQQTKHAWGVWLIAVPSAVFIAGSSLLGALSGLPEFERRVDGKLLHLRCGYSKRQVRQQFEDLEDEGRGAYRRFLLLDLVFPVLYGPALIWALAQAHLAAPNPIPSWIVLLPLVAMLADWLENTLLLRQMARFPDRLEDVAIFVAGAATIVKLAAVIASALTILGLVAWSW